MWPTCVRTTIYSFGRCAALLRPCAALQATGPTVVHSTGLHAGHDSEEAMTGLGWERDCGGWRRRGKVNERKVEERKEEEERRDRDREREGSVGVRREEDEGIEEDRERLS